MTESEWVVCEDPQAMLQHFSPTSTVRHHQVSNRKLLMFSYACGERCGKSNISESASGMEPMSRAMRWANPDAPTWIEEGPNRITQKEKADILRDIIGNPFRHLWQPHAPECPMFCRDGGIRKSSGCGCRHPWFTPTVLAIARAAYEERPGRKCEECNETGMIGTGYGQFGWKECEHCHGTGRIEDGSLDPVTLSILADALEDAGCDNVDILMHLRGKQQCNCENSYDAYTRGCDCNGSGWKTMEGHHVRGCHVLDIILGKE